MEERNDVTQLGNVLFRNDRRSFGIRQADRLLHLYMIGKTGTGKSTLLASMARQDLLAGRGFCFIDPHGDVVEKLAAEGANPLLQR